MKPEKIKAVRQAAEMTQVQFAEALGTSFEVVSRWETGVSKPRPMSVKMIKMFMKERGLK